MAALRLDPEMAAALARLGLCRVGQLAEAPRALLACRFGAILSNRLDQALGLAAEPTVPLLPAETIAHRFAFEEPMLDPAASAAVIARLSAVVCAVLERHGLGARQLDLLFERVDGSAQAVRISTVRPSRDAAHLARLLTERLEGVDLGQGVEAMRLGVGQAEPMPASQLATDGSAAAQDPLTVLVDRLENRLGRGRVYRAVPVESDVPEHSVRRVPALSLPSGLTWPRLPRPVRLLDPPQPVQALSMLPDQPPAAFTWRRVRHRVRHSDGPERIAGEWWHLEAEMRAVRDYWRVKDEAGRRFWLFRAGDGQDAATGDLRWFLHGLF